MENVIMPTSLAIIESVVKNVYKQKTEYLTEKKEIKSVIEKAVNEALPQNVNINIKSQLVDAIFNELPSYSIAIVSQACKRIISAWPEVEQSIKPNEIAINVSNNLAQYFFEKPDLRVLIAINDNKLMQKCIDENKLRLITIEKKLDDLPETIESAMKSWRAIKQMSRNSLLIVDEYQNYFSKELFLERNQPDNKVAYLKDVYIENDFIPLDLYQTEIDVSLIGFISEFVNDNVLRKYYKTRYSTDTGILKLLIVKGQPGSGKSSLFYALAHLKTHDVNFMPGINFYFIKLIELYPSADSKPSAYPITDILKSLGLSLPKDKCVFVLDGLDEICALTGFDSDFYCKNLAIEACRHKNVKVILTTRLNYVNVPHYANKNVFNIQLKPLSESGLRRWVDAYFNIHTELVEEKRLAIRNIDYIQHYRDDKADNIKEIVAIPLLFYMIVVTSINIQSLESVGQLYDMVFSELKSRHYNDNNASYIQNHAANDLLRNELPRRVAISIAAIMYKYNEPLIEIKSIDLEKSIKILQNEYRLSRKEKENLEKLFPITFYYKKRDDVVEFAHRSIMEFFAAEHLYMHFCSCEMSLLDYVINYMTEPVVWGEVASFFAYFWNTRKVDKLVEHYAKTVDADIRRITSPDESLIVRGAAYSYESNYLIFKIYWFLAHDILGLTDQLNSIMGQEYYNTYLSNILSVKSTEVSTFFDQTIHPWNFSEVKLYQFNFGGNLFRTVFDKSEIANGYFDKATLIEASFKSSSSLYLNFKQCYISDCLFRQKKPCKYIFQNCSMYKVEISTKLFSGSIDLKFVEELIRDDGAEYTFAESQMKDVSFQAIPFSKVKISSCYMKDISLKKTLISLNDFCTYWERELLKRAEDIILDLRMYKIHYEKKEKKIVSDGIGIPSSVEESFLKKMNSTPLQTLFSRVNALVPISDIDIDELNKMVGVKFSPLSIAGEIFFLF